MRFLSTTKYQSRPVRDAAQSHSEPHWTSAQFNPLMNSSASEFSFMQRQVKLSVHRAFGYRQWHKGATIKGVL